MPKSKTFTPPGSEVICIPDDLMPRERRAAFAGGIDFDMIASLSDDRAPTRPGPRTWFGCGGAIVTGAMVARQKLDAIKIAEAGKPRLQCLIINHHRNGDEPPDWTMVRNAPACPSDWPDERHAFITMCAGDEGDRSSNRVSDMDMAAFDAREPEPDDDAPEMTDAEIAKGELRLAGKKIGRPKADRTKQLVSLRLDPEILMHFQAEGPGWQTRINEALLNTVKKFDRKR